MCLSFWVKDCFKEKQNKPMLLTDDIFLALALAMKLMFITSVQLDHITNIYQLN